MDCLQECLLCSVESANMHPQIQDTPRPFPFVEVEQEKGEMPVSLLGRNHSVDW